MTFKFKQDESVVLAVEQTDFLPAGTKGTVFCFYESEPPAYEIIFHLADGTQFGAVVEEHDLMAVNVPSLSELSLARV